MRSTPRWRLLVAAVLLPLTECRGPADRAHPQHRVRFEVDLDVLP